MDDAKRKTVRKMNDGKKFELAFKNSVPDYCLTIRLNDSAQAFKKSNLARFTLKNKCDFIIFNSVLQVLYCLELKSTKYKSMSFEDIYSDESQEKMIHKHQILALRDFSTFENVVAGFVFNFRDEANKMERTYFQEINDFLKMCKTINKKSFNEMDLIMANAVKLDGIKKRTNYTWNIEKILEFSMEV